mmetsp:Transcript_58454/g.139664  ORF Transcript_58454/g.139664 Transcript_58454/m.139664 type:complete len:201 (+) Transcript_58454:199-801(+)
MEVPVHEAAPRHLRNGPREADRLDDEHDAAARESRPRSRRGEADGADAPGRDIARGGRRADLHLGGHAGEPRCRVWATHPEQRPPADRGRPPAMEGAADRGKQGLGPAPTHPGGVQGRPLPSDRDVQGRGGRLPSGVCGERPDAAGSRPEDGDGTPQVPPEASRRQGAKTRDVPPRRGTLRAPSHHLRSLRLHERRDGAS